MRATIVTPEGEAEFEFDFDELHNLANAVCAVAIGVALEVPVPEMARRTARISFSRLRGERLALPGGSVLINDCYNANPISMRAALEHLASMDTPGRHVAVLGEMRELGSTAEEYHREIGAEARRLGVEPILGVGELGRDYAPDAWAPDAQAAIPVAEAMVEPGDAVLIKGSRAVGLELLTDELVAHRGTAGE
jgi:UDP-N-acetylmuramoyl-tripeptide--D-alanyl-D-alanine ligase